MLSGAASRSETICQGFRVRRSITRTAGPTRRRIYRSSVSGEGRLPLQVPVRVRRVVVEEPASDELPVGHRLPPDLVEEGAQREVEPPQVVERHARKVVVLQVVRRGEIPEVPESG